MKKINKKSTKDIPTKNYFSVFLITFLIILVCVYARSIYLNYKETIKNTSVFHDISIKQINKDDLDFAFEENNEVLLYVSYTGDINVYNMEKKLLKEIKNNRLNDKVVYWDVTNDKNYLELLKKKYPNIDMEITSAPLFIYIKSGTAVEAMSSELKMIDSNVLNKLIEKYDIK